MDLVAVEAAAKIDVYSLLRVIRILGGGNR